MKDSYTFKEIVTAINNAVKTHDDALREYLVENLVETKIIRGVVGLNNQVIVGEFFQELREGNP